MTIDSKDLSNLLPSLYFAQSDSSCCHFGGVSVGIFLANFSLIGKWLLTYRYSLTDQLKSRVLGEEHMLKSVAE